MAIVENFWLKNSRKRLAGSVIYQAMGQTRQRELATSVSNPRTQDQMTQRVKWANLVNLYRANRSWMKYAFETKKENQSEYNKFMSLNVSNSRIYLPKQVANAGGCVVDNYIITQGSLPSIETVVVDEVMKTNIYLSDGTILQQLVTVGEVTRDLLVMNPALREGDQLSLIIMVQQSNSNTGYPYVIVRKYEVVLDSSSVELFYNYMPREFVGADADNNIYFISVSADNFIGGYAMILSRTIGGKTYTSTQNIVTVGNAAMIANYSSQAALQAAIQSYGESENAFLSSTTAAQDSQAAIATSIIAATIDGTELRLGGSVYPTNFTASSYIDLVFNQEITGEAEGGDIFVVKGTDEQAIQAVGATRRGNKTIRLTLSDQAANYADYALSDIYVQVGGIEYRVPFVVPNEATIGGLE